MAKNKQDTVTKLTDLADTYAPVRIQLELGRTLQVIQRTPDGAETTVLYKVAGIKRRGAILQALDGSSLEIKI